MAEKNNATCSICGKEYHVCLSCKDSVQLAPWKIHTDTSEHYKIYQIIRGVSTGVYTNEDAKVKFANVDLRDIEFFRPHIKNIIKDILKEEEAVVEVVENPCEVDEAKVDEAKAEAVEENVVVEKPTVSRRRNYRAEVE